jgi:aminoglycoside phosphotransferase (APT) family kinase protein
LKLKDEGKVHVTMAITQKEKTQHDLDDNKLGWYLQQEITNLKTPVVSTKIGYGQSNPTYYVDDAAGTRYILRKKPSGTIISPVAHQVDREYKVLKALGTVEGFPVPKVYCLCMDASIIGTAFYVCPISILSLSKHHSKPPHLTCIRKHRSWSL